MAAKPAKKSTRVARRKSPDQMPAKVPPRIDKDFQQVRLSFDEVALPGLAPDEKGYLVNGYYAAVRFSRGAGADRHTFGITCVALARDAVGKPYMNGMGIPIAGILSASCDKSDLIEKADKLQEVKARALDGAFREMLGQIAENAAFEQIGI